MSKEFAPILDVTPAEASRHWSNELLDILEAFEGSDEFTYTMRLTVPECEQASLKAKLEALEEDTKDLVQLLEENNWDVSFLVDCY